MNKKMSSEYVLKWKELNEVRIFMGISTHTLEEMTGIGRNRIRLFEQGCYGHDYEERYNEVKKALIELSERYTEEATTYLTRVFNFKNG